MSLKTAAAEGGVIYELLKGIESGMTELKGHFNLAKGEGAGGGGEGGDGGGEGGGGEDEEEEEGDPDHPDLNKGGALGGGIVQGADGRAYVDGSKLIEELRDELRKSNKINGELRQEIKALGGRVVELEKGQRSIALGLGVLSEKVVQPMAKGVALIGEALAGVEDAPRSAVSSDIRRVVERHGAGGNGGGGGDQGGKKFEAEDLMKGLTVGVLTEATLRNYNRFKKFHPDATENARIEAELTTKLAS